MQPLRPHGQWRPSWTTTMWPISPADPRPSHGLPSRTTPPPTPVPQKTPSSESYSRRGAEHELGAGSRRRRRCRSGPATSTPNALASCLATGTGLSGQPGRFLALATVPFAPIDRARRPQPDAGKLSGLDAGVGARLADRLGQSSR